MERTPQEPGAQEVEKLLSASKPVPSPSFRAGLERRLFEGSPAPARSWLRLRGAPVVGFAAAAGLAATFAVLGLAGTGPLSSDGADDVRAADECRYVTTLGPTRTPYVVELPDDSLEIRFRRERAERLVKRCR